MIRLQRNSTIILKPATRLIISNQAQSYKQKSTIANDENYQFLAKSKIPMLHFQPSLPRLPIPELNKTCERYLAAMKPLLNAEQYESTQKIVNDFGQSLGPLLNDLLKIEDTANRHISYITEPWSDMYLRDRRPLPINYTPFMVFKPDERSAYNDQLIRTTNLVISSLRFMRSLASKRLAPDVYHMNAKKSDTETYKNVVRLAPSIISTYVSYAFKAFPLDMSQYPGLFSSTRIPELNCDRILTQKSMTRHLIVLRNGHFFAVDVIDKDGNILPPADILARFKHILEQQLPMAEHPLGVMTTENRDEWAKLRSDLIKASEQNAKALNEIDSALFCLCLDDQQYSIEPKNMAPLVRDALCSSGTNRWFDKSFSLIVAKDGMSTVNFEHSWGDGVAVLRYFNEVFNSQTSSFINPGDKPGLIEENGVRKVEFQLNDAAKVIIANAKANHNRITNSLNIDTLMYEGLNKGMCKRYRLSPDSIMQLGFQLGYYKQTQSYTATYESCSTAAFRHGRTETIRPCTIQTKAFCDAIVQSQKSSTEMRSLIDQCSKKHGELTKEAAMGQGFDRHLFALRHMAKMHGHPIPDLYQDPSYALINHNVLSTSTLSSPALLAGGFGPVVSDGYGIGYSIQDEFVGSIVTSYQGQRNGSEFVDCLQEAYKNIKDVVEAAPKPI